ncbi:MAG: hypothetical protein AB1749_12770 [Pseudomonadota bacterium]
MPTGRITRAIAAGVVYFALVYLAGFVLGPLRELIMVPQVGRPLAVLVEAPLMIAAMWLALRWVVPRLNVLDRTGPRLVMGLAGFAVLVVAEAAMSVLLRGWTLSQWLGHFDTIEGTISLGLFLLFAAMPMLVCHAQARP